MTTTKKMWSELPKRNFNGQEQIQIKIQDLKKTFKKEKYSTNKYVQHVWRT